MLGGDDDIDTLYWIDREPGSDDDFYRASLKIMELCRSYGASFVGLACDRHQKGRAIEAVKITTLCTVRDRRLVAALADAACEHVASVIRANAENEGVGA